MGKKKEINVLEIVTPEYLKAVRPAGLKEGRSDKYSVNLYRFFKRMLDKDRILAPHRLRVWKDQGNHWWFGFPDRGNEFYGVRFITVISRGYRKDEVFCFLKTPMVEEITAEFYEQYRKIGRCIYHMQGSHHIEHDDYMLHTDGRYTMSADGKRRTCNWCGRKQKMMVVREVTKKECWEDIAERRPA
ncbi:MAG TPA: hypothetical protein PLV42_07035 [bacterium]|nr:hypothetical protein [bacterium]